MKTKTKTKTNAGIPVPGKRYDAYHDGKCSPSRHASVVIDKVVGLNDLTKKQLREWKRAINDDFSNIAAGCIIYGSPNRFWNWGCATFAVGHFHDGMAYSNEPVLFAMREHGGWYGVDWNYLLDVAGSVRKSCLKNWRACAEECNQVMKWNRKTGQFEYFDMLTKKKIGE